MYTYRISVYYKTYRFLPPTEINPKPLAAESTATILKRMPERAPNTEIILPSNKKMRAMSRSIGTQVAQVSPRPPVCPVIKHGQRTDDIEAMR